MFQLLKIFETCSFLYTSLAFIIIYVSSVRNFVQILVFTKVGNSELLKWRVTQTSYFWSSDNGSFITISWK